MNKDSCVKVRPQLNNKGVSLVEVIVALLILGIITVPLLNIFTNTARINRSNTKKANADTVAANIMEAIKVYGLQGTAEQAYIASNSSTEDTKFLGYDIKKSSISGDMSVIKRDAATGKLSFTPSAGNTYRYVVGSDTLKGIVEGNTATEYIVTIEMDSNYLNNANEVYSADLLAFNSESTLFINPSGTGVHYDEEALSYFEELNANYRDSEWDKECSRRIALNDAAIENAIVNGLPDPPLSPTPVPYAHDDPATLQSHMARETQITVRREKDSSVEHGEEYYVINSSMIYRIDPQYVGDGNNEIVKAGYCSNVKFEDLKSIYLIYVPFKYMTRTGASALSSLAKLTFGGGLSYVNSSGETVNVPTENISFINDTYGAREDGEAEHFDLYTAIQAGMTTDFEGTLTCDYTGESNEVKGYSQATLSGTMSQGTPAGLVHKNTVPQHVNRIVTVKIKVESKDDDSVVAELESTIQED